MNKIKDFTKNTAKGFLMGIVEAVPGVSGGTMALVLGIYERFIRSLSSINVEALKLFVKGNFKAFWKYIDGSFLFNIVFGMIIGIVFSIFTISKLLSTHPQELWSFFFGLVFTTGIFLFWDNVWKTFKDNSKSFKEKEVIKSNIKKESLDNNFLSNKSLFSESEEENDLEKKLQEKSMLYKSKNMANNPYFNLIKNIILLILGFITIFYIINYISLPTSDSLWLIFLSGALAFSAFLLPGISGSFVLLILGVYSTVIPTVKNLILSPNYSDFITISVFVLGMLFGLIFFSKIINFVFKKWKTGTMSLIVGIIFGSLFKLWPWKLEEKILSDNGDILNLSTLREIPEHYKVISEVNFLPMISSDTFIISSFSILGAVFIYFIYYYSNKK